MRKSLRLAKRLVGAYLAIDLVGKLSSASVWSC